MKKSWLAALFAAGLAHPSAAQNGKEDLGRAASDPTASLTSYIFQNFVTSKFHNLDDENSNRLQFRTAIPYELGGTSNIFRLTLPYVTDSAGGSEGFSDITIFNLTTFDQPWGRFGLGAVALLPTGSDDLSAEKWAVGPAAGFVA